MAFVACSRVNVTNKVIFQPTGFTFATQARSPRNARNEYCLIYSVFSKGEA